MTWQQYWWNRSSPRGHSAPCPGRMHRYTVAGLTPSCTSTACSSVDQTRSHRAKPRHSPGAGQSQLTGGKHAAQCAAHSPSRRHRPARSLSLRTPGTLLPRSSWAVECISLARAPQDQRRSPGRSELFSEVGSMNITTVSNSDHCKYSEMRCIQPALMHRRLTLHRQLKQSREASARVYPCYAYRPSVSSWIPISHAWFGEQPTDHYPGPSGETCGSVRATMAGAMYPEYQNYVTGMESPVVAGARRGWALPARLLSSLTYACRHRGVVGLSWPGVTARTASDRISRAVVRRTERPSVSSARSYSRGPLHPKSCPVPT